jgi:hypothetical protein
VVTSLNSLAGVVRDPDATKDFTNMRFGRAVVTDSSSKTIAMVQTEHFTAGGNLDGQAQRE